MRKNEPRHWSMLRTSLSPTIIQGGYRTNVIPSEATATIDTRLAPDEDPAKFLELVKQVVNDPSVEVTYGARDSRPLTPTAKLDSDVFKALEAMVTKHYKAITLPTMSTGATDMAFLRRKGIQCYGIGPALDIEDGPKGFGAHSDQERILESELHALRALQLGRGRRSGARQVGAVMRLRVRSASSSASDSPPASRPRLPHPR